MASQLPLTRSENYLSAVAALSARLHPPLPPEAYPRGVLVSEEGLLQARETFRLHMRQANSVYEVVAVVYALMHVIEAQLGSALITEFRSRRSSDCPVCCPVEPTKVLPKASLAFGTDIIEPTHRLSPSGLLDESVLLADAFGRLTATPHEHEQRPTPALHAHSGSGHASREEATWRVAMLSILADIKDVDWQTTSGSFRGSALRSPLVRTRLEWALERCEAFAPDVVVIPELNLDADLTVVIQHWLQREPRGPDGVSPLVVYGALHTPSPAGASGYRNRPGLLTPLREIEWEYWKVNPVYDRKNGMYENLAGKPPHVVAIDLPVGRVGVLICKDFLTDEVRRAVEQLRPTLLIVPAMTTPGSVELFRTYARAMASSLRCVTVFCNSSILLRAELAAVTAPRDDNSESAAERHADGGPLGVLQATTRMRYGPLSHSLGLTPSTAVVGLYTLSSSVDGLDVTCDVKRLTPEEEAARVR